VVEHGHITSALQLLIASARNHRGLIYMFDLFHLYYNVFSSLRIQI